MPPGRRPGRRIQPVDPVPDQAVCCTKSSSTGRAAADIPMLAPVSTTASQNPAAARLTSIGAIMCGFAQLTEASTRSRSALRWPLKFEVSSGCAGRVCPAGSYARTNGSYSPRGRSMVMLQLRLSSCGRRLPRLPRGRGCARSRSHSRAAQCAQPSAPPWRRFADRRVERGAGNDLLRQSCGPAAMTATGPKL